MLEVYFRSNDETMNFCDYLFSYSKKIDLHWQKDAEWGNRIQVNYNIEQERMKDALANAMVDVFNHHRLTTMMREIIEGVYYYTNQDEIERIMDLTQWIFTGEDEDSLFVRDIKDPNGLLRSIFFSHIQDATSIHFDSIIKFRFTVFKEQLIHLVGLAIDEFKREEDHQAFIDMLREYIAKKQPIYDTIHVIQGNAFTFFKPTGERFSNMELRKIMHEEPLYIVGLDGNEMNLAPLVSMAPKNIKIYGDHPSEPKTLTIINVFQEKVDFMPHHSFPFTFHKNN
ncbi:putative sporulation protein YtxC [Virgibacillus soli]|uniref:Sporulation protein YtxC n=1 Tax=Paracerasibacillus soli TaxID=480284 RepID=A0ABU5CQI5_9BACI|nr:putative sporulation protein YtxC [Virgibacillus soli]MDY0408636.1 putative sporulation protein YtxC [Virgibacillus soli]